MRVPLLFDISGGELMIILVFVLLFFGAKGIPDIARGMGRFMRQIRDASNEVQREIKRGTNEIERATSEHQRKFRSLLEEDPVAPKPGPGPGPGATQVTGPPTAAPSPVDPEAPLAP